MNKVAQSNIQYTCEHHKGTALPNFRQCYLPRVNMNDSSGHAAILHIRKLSNPKLTTCVLSIDLTIIYN